MKNILIIHQSSEMYGSDKVILYLVSGLLDLGGYHPIIVLPEDGPLKQALANIGAEVHTAKVAKVSRKAFTPLGLLRLFFELIQSVRDISRLVGTRNIEIVHSNTLAVLSGAFWAFIKRKKHLWHVHEIILSPKFVSKLFPLIIRIFSDKVISNSTLTEKWLISEQPVLVERSVVIFNGLPNVVKPSNQVINEFRKMVGAKDTDLIITLAGRLNKWKGQELLLEAAAILKNNNKIKGLKFVIVGSPAPGLEYLRTELREYAKSNEIDKDVCFIEFVDDIWPVWFGTDIAVVPSTEPEPFGMVAIEAMAANLPVIAASHGGLLDIVMDDQTGILFNPKDAQALSSSIHKIASDAELRSKMGNAGVTRQQKNFSIQSQVLKTVETYKAMCDDCN